MLSPIKRTKWWLTVVAGILLSASGLLAYGRAQRGGTTAGDVSQQGMPSVDLPPAGPAPRSRNGLGNPEPKDPGMARMQEERERMAKDERHKHMATDVTKLLQLATDLKEEVDKSTKNEMSVSAFQKANEIERLAHDVKERLRN
jgi:hypothetical protein